MIFKPQVQSFPRLAAPSNVIWNSPLEDKQAILREACAHYEPENEAKCFCIMSKTFQHDSSWGTVPGIGKDFNNPGNMKCRKEPKHNAQCRARAGTHWSYYPTVEDGIWGNVELYADRYKDQSPEYFMSVWVQTGERDYHNAIHSCF